MFTSYAQNFEDVILNRIFKNKESGFYIDIGAHHPVYDSVTKAFYDRGWQGINIEPVREFFELLQRDRPRDINLNLAVGERETTLEFFELQGSGFSTFDKNVAIQLASERQLTLSSYEVSVVTLAEICQKYSRVSIDFLKIDVEGWEEQVIVGNDWNTFRPSVIVLEATIPNSPVRRETNIAKFLQDKNYHLVYFDGLNDYYLAEESRQLSFHFQVPPNIFDKFSIYQVKELTDQRTLLNKRIQECDEEIIVLNQRLEKNYLENQNLFRENNILDQRLKDQFCTIQPLLRQITILSQSLEDERLESQRLSQELKKLKLFKDEQLKYYQIKESELQILLSQIESRLAHEISDLYQARERIIAMESSKFWKLRHLWFRLRKRLGIPGN